MSWPFLAHLLRTWWRAPLRMALLAALILVPLASSVAAASSDLAQAGTVPFLALVIGAGALGADASSGRLPLMVTRPLERWRYLLTWWFAVATLSAVAALIDLGLSLAGVLAFGLGDAPTAGEVLVNAADRLVLVATVSAVMVSLATLARGLGNLALWGALLLLTMGLDEAGQAFGIGLLRQAAKWLYLVLRPRVDVLAAFSGDAVSFATLLAAPTLLVTSLALGALVLGRRDIHHAASSR